MGAPTVISGLAQHSQQAWLPKPFVNHLLLVNRVRTTETIASHLGFSNLLCLAEERLGKVMSRWALAPVSSIVPAITTGASAPCHYPQFEARLR